MERLSCLRAIRLLATKSSRYSHVVTRLSSSTMIDAPCNLQMTSARRRRVDETLDVTRQRLQYQSRKRGMLENCILLSTFSAKYLASFSPEQLGLYDHIINAPSNDWQIYYWATGAKQTPDEFDNEVMDLLKAHTKNEAKELRATIPGLI